LFELQVSEPEVHSGKVIGHCDGKTYKLASSKKKISNEVLRDIAHLRSRTKLISSVARVRNNLAYATHKFFQERGFQYIHTPIITASDCEGAGEMFQVTTALPPAHDPISKMKLYEKVGQEAEEKLARESTQKKVEESKGAAGGKKAKGGDGGMMSKNLAKKMAAKHTKKGDEVPEDVKAALEYYEKLDKGEDVGATGAAADGEEKKVEEKKEELIPLEDRKVNYHHDFFGRPAFLTVSG
jgi:asparaginyl-tRNA synthetase